MPDNDNRRRQGSHGEKYKYTPDKNLSTVEKQRAYYRQLADDRASHGQNVNRAPSTARPPVVSQAVSEGGGKKHSGKRRHRRRMSGGKKALIAVLCILIVLILAVGGTGFYYLNLIDFDNGGPVLAPTNPDGDDDEADILNGELSADESSSLADANASINANLDNNEIWYSDEVTNILLMGIDYGSSSYPYGRSDSMIVVSINNHSHKIKLISLSRAVYSAIEGYKNTRLSHAHGYGGPELAIKAIQNNYKIRIDNYASVTFADFEHIIDALGGVTVTLESKEAAAISGVLGHTSAGTYNLNGRQALAFARTRKIDSDRNRTGRQRRVLEALANKATTMSIPDMMGAMDDVLPYVKTNMSRTQLISMLSKALTYLNYQREEYVIPHESSDLVLRGGFEVLLVNWGTEVPYVHELFYGDVEAKVQ